MINSLLLGQAKKQSGRVYSCGRNSNGQLGDATTLDKLALTLIDGSNNYLAVSEGNNHTMALRI